tara:strand:+ start:6594 stop:7919 length:1326 start_codon:yes stop_codon:yes gene_type:complete
MNRILIILTFLLISFATKAQFENDKTWLVITADNNQYGSFFKESFDDALRIKKPSFSIGIEHYLSKSFNFSGKIAVGKITDHNSGLLDLSNMNNMRVNIAALEATAIFKFNNGFILPTTSKITPFIEAGFGIANFNEAAVENESGPGVVFPLAAGFKYRFTKNMQFMVRVANVESNKVSHRRFSAGFSFSLKNNTDTDKDGIIDKEDACPTVYGPAENLGCPYEDTDNDGVEDRFDECPLIAGTINGCPDMDGDKVPDKDDNCPRLAGKAEMQGCPDTDGDGVKDSEDACPNIAGTVNGCPDTDKDGLIDKLDKCPNNAGSLAEGGCPEIKLPLYQVYFDFNKAEINASTQAKLDDLAELMAELKIFKVAIYGHTDNIGQQDENYALSQKRAEAVRDYLLSKGVDVSRAIVIGYGEEKALASNVTKDGRALNRRVEIKIKK